MVMKYRMNEVMPPFLTRTIVGEEKSKGVLINCVEQYEILTSRQDKNPISGQMETISDITNATISNDTISQGEIILSNGSYEFCGVVEESHKLFDIWKKSLEQYRLQASRIAPPTEAQVRSIATGKEIQQ